MTTDNINNIFLQVDTDSLDIPLELKENDDGAPKHNLRDLFKHRILLKRTLISFFQWFVVVGTFYGLAFGAVKARLFESFYRTFAQNVKKGNQLSCAYFTFPSFT